MKFIIVFLLLTTTIFAKVNIAVSILPQKTFVEKIGKDKVNVIAMVKPGNNPHNFEPKPSHLKEISASLIYFPIKIEFENSWLHKFASQNNKMKIVDMTKGVQLITMVEHEHHHDDEDEHKEHKHEVHDHDDHHKHDIHDHDDHDKKIDYDEHIKPDPHTWTSPFNVKIMAKNIYEALVEIDEENKDFYKTNYLDFLDEINNTDKEIRTILSGLKTQTKFMVFHPSWGYFARDYSLTQFPVEVEGKEPKPKMLLEIIKEARHENIKAIFTQKEFSDKSAKTIAKELNIKVLKETPLAPNWSENLINMAKAIANN